MKFRYNTNFTLPKQSQGSKSVLQDGPRSLVLFWKEKNLSYNRRNTVLQCQTKLLIVRTGMLITSDVPIFGILRLLARSLT